MDEAPLEPQMPPPDHPVASFSVRVCAAVLVLYALYYARSLFIPMVMAIAFYLTFRPIVRRGRLIGIPSTVGAAGIVLCLLVAIGLGTLMVIDPARTMLSDAPRHMAVVKQRLSFVLDKLEQVDEAKKDLSETGDDDSGEGDEEDEPVPVEIKQPAWSSNFQYISGTGNLVSFAMIFMVLSYFLLAAGDDLLRGVMRALPSFTARRQLIEVIQNVQEGLGSYLAQVTVINAGLGVCVAIAMWLLGMPSPVLWGVMAFAFNYVPIVGAITGAVLIFLVAIIHYPEAYFAFIVTAIFVTLTSLEGQFITPAILGRSMSINPVLVVLSIVVWGWMWGMMGVFLSVPILIAARMTCEHYQGLLPLAKVLGADVSQVPTGDDAPVGLAPAKT